MAEMLIQSESLTKIADKIRVLSGTEDAMGLDDMAEHVGEANEEVDSQANLISQIVNTLENKAVKVEYKEVEYSENENAMVTGTLSNYANDIVTTIGSYAFCNCSKLTTVSFSACTTIGDHAFDNCSSLTSVSFPTCTTIGDYAFYQCSSLTSVSFSVCTTIGKYAFYSCKNLTSVSFPVCTTIGNTAFRSCTRLTTVSFPVCTSISSYVFDRCRNLTTVSFPACTTIGGWAFSGCYNLKSFYLTGSSLCKLSNSNAFTSTPIGGYSASAGTYGSIYVPASLLTSYKKATNWTYFSSRFVGI